MNYITQHLVISHLLAQAYGTDSYGTSTYSCTTGQVCTTNDTSVLAPLTGFMREQPPTIVIPVLLVAAVMLAALGLLISKLVAKVRRG